MSGVGLGWGEWNCCRNCGSWPTDLHHALPKSICSEGYDEPLNHIRLCHECHMLWHAHRIVIYRDVFTLEQWTWISAHARPQWLNDWYPARQLRLPF